MKNSALLAVIVAAVTMVAACNRGNGDAGPRTTSQIAADEIATNTADNAEPLLLNDLPISDADTDESAKPVPLI